MYKYSAFGLSISSELELPALLSSESSNPNLTFVVGAVDKQGLKEPTIVKPFCQMADDELWLHVPDIAWFYVENGNKVTVEPAEGADEQSVRLFLMGSCMGAIMYQRNRLVIHGNAIKIGDECVVFAGVSGNGKSTLAAAFHKRGYEILADDLSVIDDDLKVQPSYPQIKLWHDTAKKLAIDISSLKKIRLQVDKYAYPIRDSFCNQPLPIRAIYILHTHNQDEFEFETVQGMAKFNPLKNQSYRKNYIDGLGMKPAHLKLCAKLANKVDVTHITRPNADFRLNELVDLVLRDLERKEVNVA